MNWHFAKLLLLSLLSLTFLSACWWESSEEKEIFFHEVEPGNASIEVELPTMLWEELEELGAIVYQTVEGETEKYYADKTFLPFTLQLIEKDSGVLGGKNYAIKMGQGGGSLDYKDFATDSQGEFYLQFQFPEQFLLENIHVFYLSNARRKSIKEDIVGSGCKVFLDITSHFRKSVKSGGILLKLNQSRHAYITTGTFFLATLLDQRLHLSQLTISDSRFPDISCRP